MFDFFKRMGAKAQGQMIKGLAKEYITADNVNAALDSLKKFQAEKEAEAGSPLFLMAYRDNAGQLVMAVYKHENGQSIPHSAFTLTGPQDIIKLMGTFFPDKSETETNDSQFSARPDLSPVNEDEHGRYIWEGERKQRIGRFGEPLNAPLTTTTGADTEPAE